MAPARVSAARRSVKPRPGVGAASRLDLLEALLTSRDAGQCAQRALTWLQRQTGARRALCLAQRLVERRPVPIESELRILRCPR